MCVTRTRRCAATSRIKLLLLHGGPGGTHEYLEAFKSLLAPEGIEFIYYDQLGSAYSDQPKDPELWTIDRFVDEVEQVRVALGWIARTSTCTDIPGGMLAIEYALTHGEHLKALIISNIARMCRARDPSCAL